RTRGQVAEPRAVLPQHRHEAEAEVEQGEGEVPDGDVEPVPAVDGAGQPPSGEGRQVGHAGSLAASRAARAERRSGTISPRRCATTRRTTAVAAQSSTENTLPSGPNAPPVTSTFPDVEASSRPCEVSLPDTSVENSALPATFQPRCRPMGSHRRRVATYAAVSMPPASIAMAIAPHRVAFGLSRCARPNSRPVSA